ncbi:MAG: hypothetical protein M3458_04790 [Acidobacteriota bacterium]|nr:hypothetical protein [Acidobacteriota bacterium]
MTLSSYQFFDGLGRPSRSFTFDPQDPSNIYLTVNTKYDAMGRVWQVSNPYRSIGSASNPDALSVQWTESLYDALGRVTTVKTPDGAQVVTFYSGNEVTVTDQAGKARQSVTDALGRLVKVSEAPNSSGYNYQTHYLYDALSNLRTVRQGGVIQSDGTIQGGQTRSFVYDSLSRLTSATNPESGTLSYQYDANGNLTQKTDARNVTTTYTYDALNRAQTRTYTDGTPAVTYQYDGVGVTGGVVNAQGRLTQMSSSVSMTSYDEFDVMGRVTRHTQSTDGQTYQMSNGYDLAGNLIAQTYPSGRVVTTSIDAAGRVMGVSGQQGAETKTYASAISYTAHGAVSAMQLGNSLWEHTHFNVRLQPTRIGLGTSSVDTSTLQLDYAYGAANNNGNVASQTITIPGGPTLVQSYTYDALNRLEVAQENGGSWQQRFIYDRYGNRTFDAANTTANVLGENPDISPANNRIVARAGEHYRYDAAGNLDRDMANNAYGYDAENRQVSYSGGASYAYDGDGRRVKKVAGVVTTVFVYNAAGQLAAEYTANGATSVGGTSYLTADTLGSPRVVTDANGGVKSRHDYLPFGEELQAAVGGRTPEQGYSQSDSVRQKFTGYERDGETQLDYAQARYYSSRQGRFTSVDPLMRSARLSSPQTFNRYSYVLNNPLSLTDPTGLQGQCPQGQKCYDTENGLVYDDEDGNQVILLIGGVVTTVGPSAIPQSETIWIIEERPSVFSRLGSGAKSGIGTVFGAIGVILFNPTSVGCGSMRWSRFDGHGILFNNRQIKDEKSYHDHHDRCQDPAQIR